MIPRVLETEVMDSPQEALDYDLMDHAEVNARFVADFLAAHGPCRGGEILDVGTGPGQIPIALCRADPRARVLGIDLSLAMLDRAKSNAREAGLTDRVGFTLADAKDMSLHEGRFEAVISNTIIHHIPEPGPALGEMARLVAPGGTLLVRDLCRPDDEETLSRLVEAYGGTEPAARALFEASLHAALTVAEVRELLRRSDLPEGQLAMTSDRHWTWAWTRPD